MKNNLIDMIGEVSGKLTVIEEVEPRFSKTGKKIRFLRCSCECGGELITRMSAIRGKKAKSCGCSRAKVDYTGYKYGRLLVIGEAPRQKNKREIVRAWNAVCDCGKEVVITQGNLGRTKSCGCIMKKVDLTGIKFGRLKVIEEGEPLKGEGWSVRRWICFCDCGNQTLTHQNHLTSGRSRSCGCLATEKSKELKTYGDSGSRLYKTWSNMKRRCDNKEDKSYPNYGGRGITYDPRWSDYINFREDMLEGYSDDLTLERVDVNGNYCKENCTWIPLEMQSRNKTKYKSNTSEFTGVSYEDSGTGRWRSFWQDSKGRSRSKSFSVKRFGYDKAKALAIRYREDKINELNRQGAGYNEQHGK